MNLSINYTFIIFNIFLNIIFVILCQNQSGVIFKQFGIFINLTIITAHYFTLRFFIHITLI